MSAPSRIINVASIAHWNAKVDLSNLQGEDIMTAFKLMHYLNWVLSLYICPSGTIERYRRYGQLLAPWSDKKQNFFVQVLELSR